MAAIIRSPDGSIRNAVQLTVNQVARERVVCPLCNKKVFAMWPEGWDAHAAHRCEGVSGATPVARKQDFKKRLRHLFR